jgi:hypothetical protein
MSSMAEGSEGRELKDELDLGNEDDLHQQADLEPLALDRQPSPQELADHELDTVDNAEVHRQASERTGAPAGPELPQTPPAQHAQFNAISGSVDETASTPDDTPSLHVSDALSAQLGWLSNFQ